MAVHLYQLYGEFDSAASSMMQHPEEAFKHEEFLQVMKKVSNAELFYTAIGFYLDRDQGRLLELLTVITPKLDHVRVVAQVKYTRNE